MIWKIKNILAIHEGRLTLLHAIVGEDLGRLRNELYSPIFTRLVYLEEWMRLFGWVSTPFRRNGAWLPGGVRPFDAEVRARLTRRPLTLPLYDPRRDIYTSFIVTDPPEIPRDATE